VDLLGLVLEGYGSALGFEWTSLETELDLRERKTPLIRVCGRWT
jgi:hypothetical protein